MDGGRKNVRFSTENWLCLKNGEFTAKVTIGHQ